MLRWIITLLSFHFFLSLGVSAYGKTLHTTPPDTLAQTVLMQTATSISGIGAQSMTNMPAELPHDPSNLVGDLVLQPMADDHVDMPDDLGVAKPLIPPEALRVRLVHLRLALPDSPSLKRRPKPPRDLPALA